MSERYQAHCKKCFGTFEDESEEAVILKVQHHEAEGKCQRPVYDGNKGQFLKQEEDAVRAS